MKMPPCLHHQSLSFPVTTLSLLATAFAAAAPELTSVALQPDGAMQLTVTSSVDSYYILRRNTNADLGPAHTPEAVKLGTGAPLALTSAVNAARRGFYHVDEVPRSASMDLDQDGMPDTFELTYPDFLNPLDPSDGPLDNDNDGVSNVNEYNNGTDPSQPPLPPVTGLVINEVDYDQIGLDVNEFVEIYNAGAAAVNLTGISLVFLNGANNAQYKSVDLGSAGSLAAGQYLVVGSTTLLLTVPAAAKTISFGALALSDNIQNGTPDGVALVNTNQSSVLDALSYEGAMNAANITGITGTVSLVEGTLLPPSIQDSNSFIGSLSRIPSGTDTDNAATDWKFSTTPTPGTANIP